VAAAKKRASRAPRKKKAAPGPRPPPAPREAQGRARPSPLARWTLWTLAIVSAASAFALLFVYPARRGPGDGREVELALVGDESPDALAAKLAGAGLVAEPRLFAVYARASGAGAGVAPGVHLFTDDLSPSAVLERALRRGAAPKVKVSIPEGWTRFDVAKRLADRRVCPQRAFLDATADPALLAELRVDAATAEGYLFPATYDLPADSLAADVVRRMKLEFDRRFAALEERHGASVLDLSRSLGWGRHQIVTLASMVEKEAVVDDERPIIAGVFVNRLRDPRFTPRLLQCDPTAAYGCLADAAERQHDPAAPPRIPSCAAFTGKITHDVVADPANPYNTYKREGLPPGPIASPGARSLEAAMAPSATRYLYFVARGAGRHTFSETYAAHAAAVDESRSK